MLSRRDKWFEKLLAESGPPIAKSLDLAMADVYLASWRGTGTELRNLLALRNGFYSFDGALLVRPFGWATAPLGIVEWNEPSLWKSAFQQPLGKALFFSEDLFGGQFFLDEGGVHSFDPESGRMAKVARSLRDWCRVVLEDRDYRTGRPLLEAWMDAEGELKPGYRLLPKVPFALGGPFGIENLYPCEAVEGMRFRASLANQTADLPSGSPVIIRISKPH